MYTQYVHQSTCFIWSFELKVHGSANVKQEHVYLSNKHDLYRLVFTSHGVVVEVLIRSVELCVLVKIKPTESEIEHRFCLWLCRLWSSENLIVGVASRSGRIHQSQCLIPGLVIGRIFRFCFRLRQSRFHLIISDGVVNGIGRDGNVLILPTLIPSSLWRRLSYDSDYRFSLGHRRSYDSNRDSESDSVAGENQPSESQLAEGWPFGPQIFFLEVYLCTVTVVVLSERDTTRSLYDFYIPFSGAVYPVSIKVYYFSQHRLFNNWTSSLVILERFLLEYRFALLH